MIRLLPKRAVSAAALTLLLAVMGENGSQLKAATITISINDFNPIAMQNILDNVAQDGDFIQLPNTSSQPGGKVTWAGVGNLDTDGVIIHKALTISGTSSNRNNGTVIENDRWRDSGKQPSLFQIDSSVAGSVRIRNIYFISTARCTDGTCAHVGSSCWCANCAINSFASTPDAGTGFPRKVRIDHCVFEKFDYAIMADCMFGVVDHCIFVNNRVALRAWGYADTTFGTGRAITDPLPWAWDSTNTWCVEDSYLSIDHNVEQFYFGDTDFPSSYTVRHCTFDIRRDDGTAYQGFDMHGTGGDAKENRVGLQLYNNVINYRYDSPGSGSFDLADIRGGVGSLVYNNTVNVYWDNMDVYCQVRADPAGSIVANNNYVWNNYKNGSLIRVDGYEGAHVDEHYFLYQPPNFKQLQYPHPLTVGKISAGLLHSLALTSDGRVWAWGDNSYGQLGIGNYNDSSTPVLIPTLHDIVAISAGWTHNLALQSDGTVWAWGLNNCGQLGINSIQNQNVPQQVQIVSGAKYIAAGAYHSLARTSGDFFAWGYNHDGELGDASFVDKHVPTPVSSTSGLWYYNVTALAAGAYHSLAIGGGGQVWSWGFNNRGQLGLGNGNMTSQNTPQQVSVGGSPGVKAIAGGLYHSLAIDNDPGYVWAWGDNTYGQLGSGTMGGYNATPAHYWSSYNVQAISAGTAHSLAVDSSGSVWSWGYNDKGQLGNNSLNNSSSPVQASSLSGMTTVSGGGHFSLSGGSTTIDSWGANSDGQLGKGTFSPQILTPVIVIDGQGGNFQF
jgi:alpha-tubulin suppressor-like RCC1 family protein